MQKHHYRKCPVCKTWLSKDRYEKALGILGAQQKHVRHLEQEWKGKLRSLKKEKRQVAEAARESERLRARRLLSGRDEEITRLRDRIRQINRGTTPQTEGLEYEDRLIQALRKAFPDDEIRGTPGGQGGDVLHSVRLSKRPVGLVLYECKRVPRILDQHVEQTYRAKQSREADFAILVTTGRKRGFAGLGTDSEVIVVNPLGVVPLASLLREQLIEIAKAKLTKREREKVAQHLVRFINSPQFKNPLHDVMVRTAQLRQSLKREAREHVKEWTDRWAQYQKIDWDSHFIRANLELVLQGREPKSEFPTKPQPLALSNLSED